MIPTIEPQYFSSKFSGTKTRFEVKQFMSEKNISKLEIHKGIADPEFFNCAIKKKNVISHDCNKKSCKKFEKNTNDSYCKHHSIVLMASKSSITILHETEKKKKK